MQQRSRITFGVASVVIYALLAGCAAAQPAQRTTGAEVDRPNPTPKRIVAAVMVEPNALHRPLIPGAYIIQVGDLADTIVHMSLSTEDERGALRPALAEVVPSLENGAWRLLPDGKMELVWRIRPGAEWHDGAPFTADDLVFTMQICQDPSFPEFRIGAGGAFELVERVAAVDPQTIAVTWKAPFIRADRLFATGLEGFAEPLPRHLLDGALAQSREGFLQLPYWTREYVGLGPYKLREWVEGSHLLLDANSRYVLGRPKIDEMEVRFTTDANTLSANLLAGVVDVTLGTGLSLEQSLEVRDQWREGALEVAAVNFWLVVYPQFVNPNPPVILDVRFRRALLMAIDRQAMADVIQSGLVPIAHSYVRPDEPEYRDVERSVVRYEYDPRRAGQMLEELGYQKGPDGVFVEPSGQRLALEVRATTNPAIHTKTMFPVADYWQRLGVAAEPLVVPVQRASDLEYGATFPGLYVVREPIGPAYLDRFRGAEARLAPRFQGRNISRYQSPELDGLIERYLATIPPAQRVEVMGQIVHHISDQLNAMGLFYDVRTMLVRNGLVNIPAQNSTWNVHEWDLKS